MKSICIILPDPESITENILIKSIYKLKKNKLKKIYIIGDKIYFSKFYKKITKIKKIDFLNINLRKKSYKKYLDELVNKSLDLFNKKKINYLINMPLNKKKFFNKKIQGFTEFFSNKINKQKNENMLLYNENFSVCPLTTHEEIKNVDKKIDQKKIINAVKNIISFYKNKIKKKKIKLIVLGLNPHASKDLKSQTKDLTCIRPVVKKFKKKNVDISGPVSADTAFSSTKGKIYLGMYHDQVLIPFKMKNQFNGINITIGKKIIRISPDHGTAKNLKNSIKKINNKSFIECIKFCEKY